MEQNPKSEGKRLFCGEAFAKAGAIRHLQGRLKQKVEKGKPGQSYLVKVEPGAKWDSVRYFLSLWVDSSATMPAIDDFPRATWLECCGRLSAFTATSNRLGRRQPVCEKCAEKHAKECEDLSDCAAMSVVNSPRMGVCAYNGGSIDTERDGVFVKKVKGAPFLGQTCHTRKGFARK